MENIDQSSGMQTSRKSAGFIQEKRLNEMNTMFSNVISCEGILHEEFKNCGCFYIFYKKLNKMDLETKKNNNIHFSEVTPHQVHSSDITTLRDFIAEGRPVQQLVNANQPIVAEAKCIKACRCGQEVQLFFRPNVRMC